MKTHQAAVEWLINKLVEGGHIWSEPDPILENEEDWDEDFIKLIEQAKQMEKEQIVNAFDCDGSPQPGEKWISNGEQYYNETYSQ